MNNTDDEFANSTTPRPAQPSDTAALRIAFSTILFVMILAIGSGNGLVLLAIRRSRHLRGNVYRLVASLAVADFMVSLAMIFYLSSYATATLQDVPRSVLCYIVYTITTCSTLASCSNLVCIAIDRSISINFPLRYEAIVNERVLSLMIVSTWAIAILPTVTIYLEPRDQWILKGTCSFGTTLAVGTRTYVVSFFALSLSLMTLIYSQIYFVARGQARRIDAENSSEKKKSNKALVMLGMVVGSFVVCYVPITITLGVQLTATVTKNTGLATYFVTLLNSCLNPVIYVWKNRRMREEMLSLIRVGRGASLADDGQRSTSYSA